MQCVRARTLRLAGQEGGASWRDAAVAAQVGWDAARVTVENMVRAGDLVKVGAEKVAGSNNWASLYEMVYLEAPPPPMNTDAVEAVMATWLRT